MIKDTGVHLADSSNLHQINICNNMITYCHRCIFVENPEALANLQCVGNDIEVGVYPDSDNLNHTCVIITSDDTKTGMIGEIVFSGNTIEGHSSGDQVIEFSGGAKRNVRQFIISDNLIANVVISNILLSKCLLGSVCGNSLASDQSPNIINNYCITMNSCTDIAVTGNSYSSVGHFLQADANCNNVTVVGNCGSCKYDAINIAEGATVETYANISRHIDVRPW